MASWTAEQAGQFRENVRDERLVACWLLTLAGLRRSEVLGLRWSDVDLDATVVRSAGHGVIRVERTRVVWACCSPRCAAVGLHPRGDWTGARR